MPALSIVIYGIIFGAVFGWFANIYKLIFHSPALMYWGGLEIGRAIGVFVAPLGALLGYF